MTYHSRAQIDDGALAGKGLELAWVSDPIGAFFLQIEGSGILRLPYGGTLSIGYDDQNGLKWVPIGRLLRERGVFAEGEADMNSIIAWLRENPAAGRSLMREDPSFIFFRELDGPAVGALGRPLTDRASVAADPRFVPLGAPVFLELEQGEASGLWIAQDTGGAIKGANRFDTFWGSGADASAIAGRMASPGEALILVPRDSQRTITGEDRRVTGR